MSAQPVKIQINSLEALERLIGGDSELEIEVRQSVASAFAARYLKPLAESPVFLNAIRDVRKDTDALLRTSIEKTMGSLTRDWDHKITSIKLADEWKREIEKAVAAEVTSEIRKEVIKAMEARDAGIKKIVESLDMGKLIEEISKVALIEAKKQILKELSGK
jgi:hypothetical protein